MLPCRGGGGAALENGDAAASASGRWPRRQGTRSAEKKADHSEEDQDDDRGPGQGRLKRGRQRSLEELQKAEGSAGGPQQDPGEGAEESQNLPGRASSGLRFRFTRNGVSL